MNVLFRDDFFDFAFVSLTISDFGFLFARNRIIWRESIARQLDESVKCFVFVLCFS